MTGQWRGPDDGDALADVLKQLDPSGHLSPARFVSAMQASGLILRAAYYVPDIDELLGQMRQISYHMRTTRGVGWVMCRETLDALAAKYGRTRAPAPMRFDAGFWSTSELPTAALEMEVLHAIEHNRYWGDDKSKLFGMPVRIDPAARSPLFEVRSEDRP